MSVFELLSEQVDIADVARRFTDLGCLGKRLRGRCPLPDHDDSSPSFYVYDDRAHCYGCRFDGDVVDLWAACRGLQPVIEAALDLAREYGVRLPERDPEAQKKADERRRKEDGFTGQAGECHAALSRHLHVAAWLKGRGFDDELQQRFLLGANRDGTSAVIPYWTRGRIQGLIRRQLQREPKYLLPKAEEFPGGHKPLFILGGGPDLHLVEGFVDALSLAALGFSAAAVGGTGINDGQKAELQKFKGTIYILPDADEEGAKAALEWARVLPPRAALPRRIR